GPPAAESSYYSCDGGLCRQPSLLLREKRSHRSLQTDHGAHDGVQHNKEGDLRKVLPQSEPHLGHSPVRLRRRLRAKTSGCGGRSASTNRRNSAFDVNWSAGLKRRSKPIVEPGFPLRPLPQAAPPKCAG